MIFCKTRLKLSISSFESPSFMALLYSLVTFRHIFAAERPVSVRYILMARRSVGVVRRAARPFFSSRLSVYPVIAFRRTTVNREITIDRIKDMAFRKTANRLPNAAISAGSCMMPIVTHAVMKAVTANKETPLSRNSPPMI